MPLHEYRRKRNFNRSPEPQGGKARAGGPIFVVQKHAARRLHYDFRLELDGVLKSWAVPKGPSLDPSVKSLAVQVEDHPLDYAQFEGTIPKGEYGGGTVMVWDQGTWTPEENAARQLRSGTLKFELHGEKLRGSWVLARMRGEDDKNWLLIKKKDEAARKRKDFDVLKEMPLSVVSGLDLPDIAANPKAQWHSHRGSTDNNGRQKVAKQQTKKPPAHRATSDGQHNGDGPRQHGKRVRTQARKSRGLRLGELPGAKQRPMPRKLGVQLATLTDTVPTGDKWLHEMKLDGYRIMARLQNGNARLITRNGNDWTRRFPTVAQAVEQLPFRNAIVDGEVVVLDRHGISDFQRLQNALKNAATTDLVYYVFDLPYAEGYDLTAVPLAQRKEVLADQMARLSPNNDGPIRYSDHIVGQGQDAIDYACRFAMEGLISKRADSQYQPGRSRDWLKVKCLKRQEFVIGGYTKPRGTRAGFGALLLGYYEDGRLVYCGRVGTGFTQDTLREIQAELARRHTANPPFDTHLSTAQRRGVIWVRPELVAEVEFAAWTDDGLLRHATFHGLREDKPPQEIVREEPMHSAANGRESTSKNETSARRKTASGTQTRRRHASASTHGEDSGPVSAATIVAGVHLSNPERVLYPQQGIRKLDLAQYYEAISDWILPHIVGRPLTLVRCPKGRDGECFYQKHLTDASPESLGEVTIEERGKHAKYAVVDDIAGLVSLVQIGVLEIHPWPARADRLDRPDRLIFDLDPGEGVPWKVIVQAALEVRARLKDLGLISFARISGGKGIHVVTPLERRVDWDTLKAFAKGIAESLASDAPDQYTANMSKAKRPGKVFIDFHRNQRGATAVASYSTRARAGAPVATPLRWDELTPNMTPDRFSIDDIRKRLKSLRKDPWDGFWEVRQTVTRAMLM